MDTVAEEHSLCISLKLCKLRSRAVSRIVLKDILNCLPYLKIMLAVLHPDNITTIFCRFREMVYIFLLLEGKTIPSRYLIPHDLEISKLVNEILEIRVLVRT